MHIVHSRTHTTILLQFSILIISSFRLLKFVFLLKEVIPLSPYLKG